MNDALQTVSDEAARAVISHYIQKCRTTGASDEQVRAALAANWDQIQADIEEMACTAWTQLSSL